MSKSKNTDKKIKGHLGKHRIRLSGVNRLFWAGLVLLTILMLLAVLVPAFSPYSHTKQSVEIQNAASTLSHPFGTDKFGRDIFVRVWYGTRISLTVGMGSALICGMIGIVYGSIAGYWGGKMDLLMMRAADVIDAIPSLLYVILIMLVMGANVGSILFGICISGWIELARIVRGEVQRLKLREFSMAARLAGAGTGRILWRHLLPNAAGPIIVNLTFMIPKAIFTEAFLSFVGVGISAPDASLGTLIQDARSQMQVYPSQMLYPILVLCILIFSMNLVGAGLERYMRQMEEG
ncbi:MAG: ABC transporter permease [Faecalicatena sp.]|uniref:ABC transporter permease n=1 Tax=Faecalicatena sp. TaxID=2005360 RepID=UPI0025883F5E|nr:ABC transporter permease [Faecalicatena sp.]MCI6468254.1 ABC transporter permease [Faecalicatena sp.]MDY5620508.1 ABC transporter permease [Lachnospiraceae bacterium]